MTPPCRAPVRPRAFSLASGETLLLEEEIEALVAGSRSGLVCISGDAGCGKSTALEHLAATFAAASGVLFLERRRDDELLALAQHQLIVYAANPPRLQLGHLAVFQLAPFSDDELIEYLLTVHKESCGSVMARITADDRKLFRGIPDLWVAALNRLAQDEHCPSASVALWRHISPHLAPGGILAAANAACLDSLTTNEQTTASDWASDTLGLAGEAARLLRHRAAQAMVVIHSTPALIANGARFVSQAVLALPGDVVRMIGQSCADNPKALDQLHEAVKGPTSGQALAASLLHHAGTGWRPDGATVPFLFGAHLAKADWPDVQLPAGQLFRADLQRANLAGANLEGANLREANLKGAILNRANLSSCEASSCDFRNANVTRIKAIKSNFSQANLARAQFDDANLSQASFEGAKLSNVSFRRVNLQKSLFGGNDLAEADFTMADLTDANLSGLILRLAQFLGTNFTKANLAECDFEDLNLAGCTFRGANLRGANLTGCVLPGVSFQGACLQNAGLAEIEAEYCDLREADLRCASFHLGSTRCGHVGSPIACEGSRTGFYTDDFDEQGFKSPEEIRKANLRGADLRGAKIDGVDFYLVDLRDALYDLSQKAHFGRCGAILVSRA